MALTILMKLGQNVEEIDPENLAKTACQNFHRFQRYSTAKGRLGGPSMDRTQKILDPKFWQNWREKTGGQLRKDKRNLINLVPGVSEKRVTLENDCR